MINYYAIFLVPHGVYKGLLTLNKKTRNQIQVGNIVHATWRARLEEHLGSYYCELLKPLSMAVIGNKLKLTSVLSLCSLLSSCLPDRVLEAKIYDNSRSYLLSLRDHKNWLTEYIKLELSLLQEMGYGLSLDSCAATGLSDNLYYVSPKTGNAVSKEAGAPYQDKLFLLPSFLNKEEVEEVSYKDIIDALKITSYFIDKELYKPHNKQIPSARIRFAELINEEI